MPEIEIIDKPKLKNFFRNITEMSFTSIMWGLWLYLFLPLLSISLWLLGVRYFYIEVIEKVGYKELINLWGKVGWGILGVFLVLRLWGYYNYWRFGKKDRRRSLSPTTYETLSEHFHVSRERLSELQSNKEVVLPIQDDLKKDVAEWISRVKGNRQL
jgi:biofilm PGA synthesis protein PgaD